MIVLKTAKELALMSKAGRITAEALQAGVRACKPGVSTWEINRVVHETITSRGATPSFLGLYGFPAAACISVNEELIHGIPDKQHIIREGDIVSIDVGACIGGYHGDSAYTVGVGELAPETKQLLRVCGPRRRAQNARRPRSAEFRPSGARRAADARYDHSN